MTHPAGEIQEFVAPHLGPEEVLDGIQRWESYAAVPPMILHLGVKESWEAEAHAKGMDIGGKNHILKPSSHTLCHLFSWRRLGWSVFFIFLLF